MIEIQLGNARIFAILFVYSYYHSYLQFYDKCA